MATATATTAAAAAAAAAAIVDVGVEQARGEEGHELGGGHLGAVRRAAQRDGVPEQKDVSCGGDMQANHGRRAGEGEEEGSEGREGKRGVFVGEFR